MLSAKAQADWIGLLLISEGWRVLDQHLERLEKDALEDLVKHESETSRSRVTAIRELRLLPSLILAEAKAEPSEGNTED